MRRVGNRRVVAGRHLRRHYGDMPEPDRRPEVRAADVDRERVAERLRRAHAEGRLDLTEFDERVAAAWAARTYGDLDVLTVDLPPEPAPVVGASVAPQRPRAPERDAVAAWSVASVLNVMIWGIIAVSVGGVVYPWWIWVAGPWGVVLLAQWISSRR